MPASIVWFRHDLRLADHPALTEAVRRGAALVPVFIWSPEEHGAWPPGAAARWWLHHALAALDRDLQAYGLRLVLRRGDPLEVLQDLVRETGADTLFYHRRYEPALQASDTRIHAALTAGGVRMEARAATLLHDPEMVRTGAGTPFQVFTPFWRTLQATLDVPIPLPIPFLAPSLAPAAWPHSLPLDALDLLPRIAWDAGLRATWQPGEAGAWQRLRHFATRLAPAYAMQRDRPDGDATSALSPWLQHGELSPRQVWHTLLAAHPQAVVEPYLRQLAWREFSYHLLYHFPHTPDQPLKPAFAALPWVLAPEHLHCWQQGRTGYPLVDAGMRQLWHTGWMHNRVRMVVASFLTKDLLQPWQEGARWFWDTLVDANLANNTQGWQWTAGCGADAQPFFRIFNPVGQGQKFDPDGVYVRRWVPELAHLPDAWLHHPWEAPVALLQQAGVTLGRDYPLPVIDHAQARDRALAAYARIQQASAPP
jgi:deoxyribodipyrimidine photo-lyase